MYRAWVNNYGAILLTCASATHIQQSVSGPAFKLLIFIFTAVAVQKQLNHGDKKKKENTQHTQASACQILMALLK